MRDYKREYAIRTKEDRNNRQKDHKDGNPNNNSISNLRVMSKSKNRSKK